MTGPKLTLASRSALAALIGAMLLFSSAAEAAPTEGQDDDFSFSIWPLFGWWRSADETGSWVFPVYRQQDSDDGDLFITPLGGRARYKSWGEGDEPGTFSYILGPLYASYRGGNTTYQTVAFPIAHSYKSDEGRFHGVFPLYAKVEFKEYKGFFSLPLSVAKGEDSSLFDLGLVVFKKRREGEEVKYSALADVFKYSSSPASREFSTEPIVTVFSHKASKRGVEGERQSILDAIAAEEPDAGDQEDKHEHEDADEDGEDFDDDFDFWDDIRWDHDTGSDTSLERNLFHTRALLGLVNYRADLIPLTEKYEDGDAIRDNQTLVERADGEKTLVSFSESRLGGIWPLYSYNNTVGRSTHFEFVDALIVNLFDSEKEYEEGKVYHERQRMLGGHLFDRDKTRHGVDVDIFPFIHYDKDENSSRFSFLGGLFAAGRTAEKRYFKFLYFPFDF